MLNINNIIEIKEVKTKKQQKEFLNSETKHEVENEVIKTTIEGTLPIE